MTNLPQSGYIKTFANFKNQKQDQKKKGKGSNCKKNPSKIKPKLPREPMW